METQSKTLTISRSAADKMRQEARPGAHYRIQLTAFTWCGPAYRLVQTDEQIPGDLELTDASGITVYVDVDAAEYFEDLEIVLSTLFDTESLTVKERFV